MCMHVYKYYIYLHAWFHVCMPYCVSFMYVYVCVLLLLVHIHVIYYVLFLCRFEFEKLVLALSTTRESAAKHISEHLSLVQSSDFSTPSAPDYQLHTFGGVILDCYVSEMGKVKGVCTYLLVDMFERI